MPDSTTSPEEAAKKLNLIRDALMSDEDVSKVFATVWAIVMSDG